MKEETGEKPTVYSSRLYKTHRKIIKKWARKGKVSDATIVRQAIEKYDEYKNNS